LKKKLSFLFEFLKFRGIRICQVRCICSD